MRTFNDNLPCQSSVIIDGISYKLRKLKAVDGNGFVFASEEPGKEAESIHLPSSALKALYLLITSNEEKK
jgi:hypothetical protein